MPRPIYCDFLSSVSVGFAFDSMNAFANVMPSSIHAKRWLASDMMESHSAGLMLGLTWHTTSLTPGGVVVKMRRLTHRTSCKLMKRK